MYTQFLSYLLAHTRTYLRDITASDPWENYGRQAHIILPHPTGWGADQQSFLQDAVVAAGLLPRDAVRTRLHFVEEGEASMTFCMATQAALAEQLTVSSRSGAIYLA